MIGKLISVTVFSALLAGSAFAQSAPADNRDAHMHGWMHQGDPAMWHASICSDRYARAAAKLAYVGAKLNLTERQRPLFEAWKDNLLGSAKAGETACLAHTPDMAHPPTALERAAMIHKMLEARLAAMDSAQPSLVVFYNSLSPAQKAQVDRMGGMDQHRFGGEWHHGPGQMHPHNG